MRRLREVRRFYAPRGNVDFVMISVASRDVQSFDRERRGCQRTRAHKATNLIVRLHRACDPRSHKVAQGQCLMSSWQEAQPDRTLANCLKMLDAPVREVCIQITGSMRSIAAPQPCLMAEYWTEEEKPSLAPCSTRRRPSNFLNWTPLVPTPSGRPRSAGASHPKGRSAAEDGVAVDRTEHRGRLSIRRQTTA